MITYRSGGVHYFIKLFQLRGSVFPFAIKVATPISFIAFLVKLEDLPSKMGLNEEKILNDNAVWSGFTFLVGFLIVFRTSQAYARFWSGCTATHLMRAEWFDSCSAIVSFCRHCSPDQTQDIATFQNVLVRLFSILHALAMAEIEDSSSDDPSKVDAYRYEIVDVTGLDEETMNAIKTSDSKVEMVYTWIQMLVVDAVHKGCLTVAPPLLTRAFQELANGMVQFHDAIKISTIPFPFPYAQLCDGLLVMHMTLTPFIVSQWVNTAWTCAVFSFLQVFTFWSLNAIAVEIENPFGTDDNDIEGHVMQQEMNRHLITLLNPNTKRVPTLSAKAVVPMDGEWLEKMTGATTCLWDCWDELSKTAEFGDDETCQHGSSFRATVRRSSVATNSVWPVAPMRKTVVTTSKRKQQLVAKRSGGLDEKSKSIFTPDSASSRPCQPQTTTRPESREDRVGNSDIAPGLQAPTPPTPQNRPHADNADVMVLLSPATPGSEVTTSPIPSISTSHAQQEPGAPGHHRACMGNHDDRDGAPAACPPARPPVWLSTDLPHIDQPEGQVKVVSSDKTHASRAKRRDRMRTPLEGSDTELDKGEIPEWPYADERDPAVNDASTLAGADGYPVSRWGQTDHPERDAAPRPITLS